jgi:uncharacterized protein YcbK (DUF882 family)
MTPSVQLASPPANHSISRRRFLRFGALAAAVSCIPCPALALERTTQKFERALDFYNVNTGESLSAVYWIKGKYLPLSLRDINYVLRDHHSDQVKAIDPQLLDLLYTIDKIVGLRDSFHVLSAYRSPATNAWLRMSHSGVAEHSMHIEGKAVDVRFFGRDLQMVRRLATDLQWGGVGYYPWSGFVHLDTGPVRTW